MSITINGLKFSEKPWSCGSCPALLSGQEDNRGFCVLFEKQKWRYNNIPSRCDKLFDKGFLLGGDLVIVINDKNSSN